MSYFGEKLFFIIMIFVCVLILISAIGVIFEIFFLGKKKSDVCPLCYSDDLRFVIKGKPGGYVEERLCNHCLHYEKTEHYL